MSDFSRVDMTKTDSEKIAALCEENGVDAIVGALRLEHAQVSSVLDGENSRGLVRLFEACFNKEWSTILRGEWEVFRKWHDSTREDANLEGIFRSFALQLEESVELYFMNLASASETYSGELFDDDTHDSFYLAAREVNRQGTRIQLEFLKDNAPSLYQDFLDLAGLAFVLPKCEEPGI